MNETGLIYIGSCINILDDTDIFADITEMAQAIDNSIKIDKDLYYNDYYNIYFKYDDIKDIHYFYKGVK